MKISRLFNSFRKKLAAASIVTLAVAFPLAVSAASMVKITADTTVANATKSAGSMNWAASTSASYNEVVAVQVVYNNTEDPSSTNAAQNLRVKVTIPSTPGASQKITTTTSSDNSNTVSGSATVNLDRADAYLQYIPGTATWKHAQTANGPMTVTQKVSDDVVFASNGILLGNAAPCQAGSIVVQARVMVPGTKVVKQVEKANESGKWATSNTANPGDTLKYMITYTNTGNTVAKNVIVRDNLPPNMTYVPGTTVITDGNYPNGFADKTDAITTDGIIIGNANPGAVAYVVLQVKVADASKLACGETRFTNVGIAHPQGTPEYYNTAYTTVNKVCNPQTPTYSCDAFHVTVGDNRKVTVDTFTFTSSDKSTLGAVTLNWGDGANIVTNNVKGQTHQYGQDGQYTISLSDFRVNGKAVQVSGNCVQTVNFSSTTPPTTPPVTPPTELPNTGAGDVIGIFAGVVLASAIGYRLFLSRKLSRQ